MGEPVRIVNTITGLGHAFVAGGIAAELAGLGYRLALPKADRTIFQNRDDMALFLRRKWLAAEQACLIAGSGVRLDRYSDTDRSARDAHTPTILMLGRLLNQKGIPEFVEVGKRIRAEFPDARFLLAGEEDAMHPGSVDIGWLRNQAHVEYLGHVQDVRPLLGQADLMLFPSYYREGVPRVIMEAAATGLPTVGFDVPGVREAVIDGETGFLVKERDLDALTERTARLLGDRKLRLKFGKKARTLAEDAFDIEKIQAEYCCIYADLGASV